MSGAYGAWKREGREPSDGVKGGEALAEVPEWSEDEIAGLELTLLARGMSPDEIRACLLYTSDAADE